MGAASRGYQLMASQMKVPPLLPRPEAPERSDRRPCAPSVVSTTRKSASENEATVIDALADACRQREGVGMALLTRLSMARSVVLRESLGGGDGWQARSEKFAAGTRARRRSKYALVRIGGWTHQVATKPPQVAKTFVVIIHCPEESPTSDAPNGRTNTMPLSSIIAFTASIPHLAGSLSRQKTCDSRLPLHVPADGSRR